MNDIENKSEKRRGRSRERQPSEHSTHSDSESETSVIDLCDDPSYRVLSAVFETEKGENVAEILSKIRKDLHVLTVTMRQLIQLSLDAQANNSDSDSASDSQSEKE